MRSTVRAVVSLPNPLGRHRRCRKPAPDVVRCQLGSMRTASAFADRSHGAMGDVPKADRTRRALTAAPVLLAFLVSGITAVTGLEARAADQPTPTARGVWLADCAVCHGAAGRGTPRGPSLAHVGLASIDFMVRTGRMPLSSPHAPEVRRRSPYSASQQTALIRYVASLTGDGPAIPRIDPARGDASAGGATYRLECAACHSWAGNGGALVGQRAPTVTAATEVQVAEAVRTGPGTMPVFGRAAISDRQMNDLLAYTAQLKHPSDRGGWNLSHLGPVSEGAAALVLGLGALLVCIRWLGERR